MPIQKTFTLVPDAPARHVSPAHALATSRPMTSKQVKKAYKEASKGPKLTRAQQRELDRQEQARIRKEFEKEKASAKAKLLREKKKDKEAAEKEVKRKAGKPLVNVRPSQDTIARFVRGNGTVKKRDAGGEVVNANKAATVLQAALIDTPQVDRRASSILETIEEGDSGSDAPRKSPRISRDRERSQGLNSSSTRGVTPRSHAIPDTTISALREESGTSVDTATSPPPGVGSQSEVQPSNAAADLSELDCMLDEDLDIDLSQVLQQRSTTPKPAPEVSAPIDPIENAMDDLESIFEEDLDLDRPEKPAEEDQAREQVIYPPQDSIGSDKARIVSDPVLEMLDDELTDELLAGFDTPLRASRTADTLPLSGDNLLRSFEDLGSDILDELHSLIEEKSMVKPPTQDLKVPAARPVLSQARGKQQRTPTILRRSPRQLSQRSTGLAQNRSQAAQGANEKSATQESSQASPYRQPPPMSTQAIMTNFEDFFPTSSQQALELNEGEFQFDIGSLASFTPSKPSLRRSDLAEVPEERSSNRSIGPPQQPPPPPHAPAPPSQHPDLRHTPPNHQLDATTLNTNLNTTAEKMVSQNTSHRPYKLNLSPAKVPEQPRFFTSSGTHELISMAKLRSRRTAAQEELQRKEREKLIGWELGLVKHYPQSRAAELPNAMHEPKKKASAAPDPVPPGYSDASHHFDTNNKENIPPDESFDDTGRGGYEEPSASQETEYGGGWVDDLEFDLGI